MEFDIESEIKLSIKHDFHKLYGRKHNDEIKLKFHADSDASKMSRNHMKLPEFNDDDRNYRVSLVTGYSLMPKRHDIRKNLKQYIEEKYNDKIDAKSMFLNLLNCDKLSLFNESPDLEFTSLKYHTILTTVLYYYYLNGYKFEDLYFGIINKEENKKIFEIIFIDGEKYFVIRPENSEIRSFAKLGKIPSEMFGYTLSRCGNTENINSEIYSNLKRISSWSTGLQYYEDIIKSRGSL